MQAGLTDTHCHLNLPIFEDDRDRVLQRARLAGLTRLLVPGVDLGSSASAISLAEKAPGLHAAVGVHPHYADRWDDGSAERLKALARADHVVAIGEIGLDYYRNHSSPENQRRAFRAQLELAAELDLPVIIHQRESMDEILDTLLLYREQVTASLASRRGVLHAYSGDAETASIAVAEGFYLGVAGPVTYRSAEALRSILREVPIERLLIETDSPYLAPVPHRGERNEPRFVEHVAEALASLHGVGTTELTQVTSKNADRLFRWCDEISYSNLS